MTIEQTASSLIANAILQYIQDKNPRFGLLVRNLPSFDTIALCDGFNTALMQQKLRLALVGFENSSIEGYPQISITVEKTVEWRNDPSINVPIIIILNPRKTQEKVHSLELFDLFQDVDLKRYIYAYGMQTGTNEQKAIWETLNSSAITRSIPLVATQVIAYYEALMRSVSPGAALPYLGLLRDPEIGSLINNHSELIGRLKENRRQVQILLSLEKQDYRTLARAFESDKVDQYRKTFVHIQEFIQNPTHEELEKLSLNEVKSLFDAPSKAPVSSQSKSRATSTTFPRRTDPVPDEYVIEQLLMNNDLEQLQDVKDLVDSRVDAFREDPDGDQAFSEKGLGEEKTRLVSEDQELNFPLPLEEQQKHPLEDLMRLWVQTDHWGGLAYGEPSLEPTLPILKIFDSSTVLHFKPLQPFKKTDDEGKNPSLIDLFKELDAVTGSVEAHNEDLQNLFSSLNRQRSELAVYRTLFLYDPVVATISPVLFKKIEEYVNTYDQLANKLQNIYSQAAEGFHDTIERAVAQFLALDVVIIDRIGKESALLTTLHPLHLWKWIELARRLKNNTEVLNPLEQATVLSSVKNIPTILNTFLLHEKMFQPERRLEEPRLVFAGEIRNSTNEGNVGIPFYEPIAHQIFTTDGLDRMEELFRSFLALYPPARLGLAITLIDPPALFPVLKSLAALEVDKDSQTTLLHGARITVYRTDPEALAYDLWTMADEEVLNLFRENPRWTFHVDLTHIDYTQICSNIKAPCHITLLCDPSTTVVQPIFRTSEEQPNPFVIPMQVAYDPLRDTVRFIQSPVNGVFDAYMKVRNSLTGELRRLTFGVGSKPKPEIKEQHLRRLSEASTWLIIMDRLHGTAELPSLGQRIAWISASTRTLAIYTQDQERWREHLEDHLQSLSIKINWKLLEKHLPDVLTIFPNGLLSTIENVLPEESKATHKAIRQNSVEKLLGVITALYWYKREHQTAILINIDPEHFHDWFGDEKPFSLKGKDYFLASWYKQDGLHFDLIAIASVTERPPSLDAEQPHLERLQKFARTLEMLFSPQAEDSLLAPTRREQIREDMSYAVFTPSPPIISSRQQTERTAIKAEWTKIINNLFSAYRPFIKVRSIRVASQELEEVGIQLLETDTYKSDIVTLSSGLLQTALEATFPTSPNFPAEYDLASPSQPTQKSDEIVSKKFPAVDVNKEQDSNATAKDIEKEAIDQQAARLRSALIGYGIAIAAVDTERTQVGPRVIRYWVKLQPPAGRLAEVQKFAIDLAREMSSKSVPIIDNIPGQPYIGIDLARENPQNVPIAPALDELPTDQSNKLLLAIGVDPAGNRIQWNFMKPPHMLVAGTTGSGKTMFLSTLIMSLVWRHSPKDVELLLVDPKQTDFAVFGQLPHLRERRVLYDPLEAITALKMLTETERPQRTALLQEANCPNVLEYNRRMPEKRLSEIVVVVDEFADIMLTLSKSDREVFERQISRLAATGRSIGIHLVLATQRPTTDIITGTIKANIPTRISFRLPSSIDSKTILDFSGAEHLLGQGDMLTLSDGEIQRLQGYYAPYEEIERLLKHLSGEVY